MECLCPWRVDLDTRRWLYLLSFVLIASLFARIPFLAALSTALIVVISLSAWWRDHVLQGIDYQRRFHFTRGFPSEKIELNLKVENRKLLPVSWLRVVDPWPRAVAPEDENLLAPSHASDQGYLVNLFSLRWFERARRTYSLLLWKRGVYPVGPARLESGDLFGIYQKSTSAGKIEKITVFPDLLPIPELDLPAESPFGERKSRRRLFEDTNRPMGIREYHPEDSFRRIHWPATARTGELQVKVYQPTSAQVMVVCLNVSTYARYWEGVYPDLLERLVSVAATLAYRGMENGYRVGLLSNGCLSNSDQPFRISPGGSRQQLAHILETLAGVTSITMAPFERFLLHEVPKVPYGSTLVIVTAITPPGLAETLVKLKRHERRMTLISLAVEPPAAVPGVHCIHLPFELHSAASTLPKNGRFHTRLNGNGS